VGLDQPDDCGVVRVSDDLALVITVDVFTPVVDDAYDYGRIAAINSLSDVYAMGARPVVAVSIAGFPDTRLSLEVLADILRGAVDACAQAGAPLVGGHTVKNPEPLFGLAVTGVVHPDRLVRKGSGHPGDVLVLTKPLGIGVMTTALKNERLSESARQAVTELMLVPNAAAAQVMVAHGARAATDVTGFGLLGHLHEMVRAAGVGARVEFSALPFLAEALTLARAGLFPGGAKTNLAAYGEALQFDAELSDWQRLLLTDPQTSGGLLIAFPPERLTGALAAFASRGVGATVIGQMVPGNGDILISR